MAIYKLEDVLTLQRGYDLPYHKLESGIYPVVQSNGISKYHSQYKVDSSEGVITGRSGTIGEVHFVEGPFWPHNTTLYVSDFKGNSPKYIYYLLKQLGLHRFSTGTGVPTLNRNHLNYVTVYLPSLRLQREIIDIIAPIESAISLLEKIIKTKKSMFHLKETGESLNDYARDTNTGYSYSKNDYVGTGKFKVFTIKNISGSTTFERTNIIRNNVLHCGDTITGMSGTIGTATVITDESQVSNQRTFAFSSDFPVQTALSIELQAQKLVNLSTGAVQRNITKDNILNLSFSPFFSKQYDDSIILELKIKKMLTAILEKIVKLLIK